MNVFTLTDPRQIATVRTHETRGAIPLYAAQPVAMVDPQGAIATLPVAFLDTRKHPALDDVWRGMAQEQAGGEATTAWRILTEQARVTCILNITWTNPVDVTLRLVFTMQTHAAFLTLAAQHDLVLLCRRPPGAPPALLNPIIVQPEGSVLSTILAAYAVRQHGRAR